MSKLIRKIDHVGIAVENLERSLPFWADALGLEVSGIETVDVDQVKVALIETGPSRIELLEPTEDGSPVARFLSRRGPGIHHLTLEVSDLDTLLDTLAEKGITPIGGAAYKGAEGRQVAFLHPGISGGVLVELVAARPAERNTRSIGPGSAVLLYLREPQEKLWGVLRKLDATGVVIEGIDLGSFDDWMGQVERQEASFVGPSVLFVPMGRLEKILLDRSSGELPSMAERFHRRIGRSVQDVLEELEQGA